MEEIKKLKYYSNGKWHESSTQKYMDIYDPSMGKVIAQTPCCTEKEVSDTIVAADEAFKSWSQVPILKRVQVMFKFRDLVVEHFDELADILCRENGKTWSEAAGDVAKMQECAEHACNIPSLMMGESLMNISSGYDCVMYREPMGVFAGIAPFNFPAMIAIGWMVPVCIMTGNTVVIKAASMTPMTAMRCMELLDEAGIPAGVVNLVTCSRVEAEIFLKHPAIRGITLVGSTAVGKHIYTVGSENGKRVQSCCEAKNHALVLNDAPISKTAAALANAIFGCAGERCMSLPAVAIQEEIAEPLIQCMLEKAKQIKIGPAYDKTSGMGPLISKAQYDFVSNWIDKGVQEGAKLLLDGRKVKVPAPYNNGFYMGPTIFDHVTPEMTVGNEEIFGPVICFKRIKTFEEGVKLIQDSRFANGAAIFTQSGYYAREFMASCHSGNCGINVAIPVPTAYFPFSGHKDSFFGTIHTIGKDSVRFYTETKVVTQKFFDEEEIKNEHVDTWGF